MRGKSMYLCGENIERNMGWGLSQYIDQIGNVLKQTFNYQVGRSKNSVDNSNFARAIHSDGHCLICGSLDWTVLQEHHIDKKKMEDFTVTLCANCHQKLHYYKGGWGRKWS